MFLVLFQKRDPDNNGLYEGALSGGYYIYRKILQHLCKIKYVTKYTRKNRHYLAVFIDAKDLFLYADFLFGFIFEADFL